MIDIMTSTQEECFDLKTHLAKYNVPERVYNLLVEESVTVSELLTFRTTDLDYWSDEHELKAIERRRFINAVKALPNAEANKPSTAKPNIVKIYLGNEEKEQIKQFGDMKANVNKMKHTIEQMNGKNQTNAENAIKDVNNVCNQIQTFVENLRNKLLKKVKLIEINQCGKLNTTSQLLKNLSQSSYAI